MSRIARLVAKRLADENIFEVGDVVRLISCGANREHPCRCGQPFHEGLRGSSYEFVVEGIDKSSETIDLGESGRLQVGYRWWLWWRFELVRYSEEGSQKA